MMTLTKRKQNSGFTLAELLVVVAIIGVLVAVSIPIFAGQLEKARRATCLANRRSLLAEVRVKALDSDLDQEAAFNALYPADKADYPCPKGGVFSWKDGQIICSVHDGTGEDTSPTITVNGEKITITATIREEYKTGDRAFLYQGDICKVGEDYYIICASYTNVTVTGTYSDWFRKNLLPYSAAKISTSSIKSKQNDIGKELYPGDLFSDNGIVYVTRYHKAISSGMNKDYLVVFGK
jgi:prepilin-type N-terminal cleavage/methylation domain-containing protein